MFRRAKRLDEGWNAVVSSSGHAEFVYVDVSYFSKERKVPCLRLRECCEERFARRPFAEDGAHRAMFPFGGWEKEHLLRNLPASGAAHPPGLRGVFYRLPFYSKPARLFNKQGGVARIEDFAAKLGASRVGDRLK